MPEACSTAMLLAAGKGERMRPLTLETPKPLLRVAGKTLIEHHIESLAAAGFRRLVINVSWLGDQIIDACGDGSRWSVEIRYSREESPLETAGGIVQALPLLAADRFAVVNADIYTDFPLVRLREQALRPAEAKLVLVANPAHHPDGDFSLANGLVHPRGKSTLTFAGIGLYDAGFFGGCDPGKRPLLPLLQQAITEGRLLGEAYAGNWTDVGTPARLEMLNRQHRL
jgi:MurNAc alpha-1-phosphate uridylyltransferase